MLANPHSLPNRCFLHTPCCVPSLQTVSMDHFIGFLSTWSPYAAYRATFPHKEDPLIELRAQFK